MDGYENIDFFISFKITILGTTILNRNFEFRGILSCAHGFIAYFIFIVLKLNTNQF